MPTKRDQTDKTSLQLEAALKSGHSVAAPDIPDQYREALDAAQRLAKKLGVLQALFPFDKQRHGFIFWEEADEAIAVYLLPDIGLEATCRCCDWSRYFAGYGQGDAEVLQIIPERALAAIEAAQAHIATCPARHQVAVVNAWLSADDAKISIEAKLQQQIEDLIVERGALGLPTKIVSQSLTKNGDYELIAQLVFALE